MLAEESRGLALREAVEATAPSPLRSCVLGTMAYSSGQLAEAERRFSEALAQARDDPGSQALAALIANRLAGTYTLLGDGEKVMAFGRQALDTGRWTRRPPARRARWSPSAPPRCPGRAPAWPS